jgi:hypothetical protein
MNNMQPIQVKAARPIVVKAIVEEEPKFNIVDVYVEKQETDPPSWKMFVVDANGQQYPYDLHFS